METIEEEEVEQENLGLKEWTEDDDDEVENICNLYNEL